MKLKSIRIDHLWGTKNISWDLDPDVNILSGVNGMGKSTLLNCIENLQIRNAEYFSNLDIKLAEIITTHNNNLFYAVANFPDNFEENKIPFNPAQLILFSKVSDTYIPKIVSLDVKNNIPNPKVRYFGSLTNFDYYNSKINIIKTFDTVIDKQQKEKILSSNSKNNESLSLLDIKLISLQNEYLNYQVKLGKKVEVKLKEATENVSIPTIYKDVFKKKSLFIDHINHLFQCTNKTVNEEENKLIFSLNDKNLTIQQLSSGEKQILIILLTALIHGDEEYVLLMDEPEISLHFDWQKQLIKMIKDLSPNCQIIIATHSPAIAMDGWLDKIVEMSTIVK